MSRNHGGFRDSGGFEQAEKNSKAESNYVNPDNNDKELLDENGNPFKAKDGTYIPNNKFVLAGRCYETDDCGKIYKKDKKYYPNDWFILGKKFFQTDENGMLIKTQENSEATDSSLEAYVDSDDSNDDAKDDTEKNIEELTKEYIDDLKKNSECPDTISDASIKPEDLKKRPPGETKELREKFNSEKKSLIAKWEKENGREWPVYENDVYNEYGEIVRRNTQ